MSLPASRLGTSPAAEVGRQVVALSDESAHRRRNRHVALAGDRVCTEGHRYVVEDRLLSPIADRDHAGRPLSPYPFCSTVPPGDAFLAAAGDSNLDSRYFGPVSLDDFTPAVPLWTSY